MSKETKRERTYRFYQSLERLGVDVQTADKLRRIEMTLSRWSELECGDSRQFPGGSVDYAIERSDQTGKPYMVRHVTDGHGTKTYRDLVRDRETGALKRLAAIMANYPELAYYHQGDPRGCSLWLVRKSDLGDYPIESVYTRGVAVCID